MRNSNSNRQAQKRPGRAESAPSYIPTDLLRLILSWLPVKSLCRFKCVSASWNSIISDPNFEELQFDRSASAMNLLISVYHSGSLFFSTSFGQQHKDDGLVEIRDPFSQSLGGLIRVCFDDITMRIYNPSTGESSCVIRIPELIESCKAMGSVFGYDPIGRTHKIMAMWFGVGEIKYRVLTLDNQMKWRSLAGSDSREPIDIATISSICLSGVVYCFGLRTSGDLELWFGGFDVRSEVLRWVRLPQTITLFSLVIDSLSLVGFNGRAAIYERSKLNDYRNDEVILWIFQGFDEQQVPWRCITISKSPQWKQVIGDKKVTMEGTVPSGELLFRNLDCRALLPITLFYYNMESKIIRTVSVLPRPADTELLFKWSQSKSEDFNFVSLTGHVESIKSLKYISD